MTPHFTIEELTRSRIAEERGIDNRPPEALKIDLAITIAGLERVRAALGGRSMILSSGYRCPALNSLVGGAKESQHMLGQAADFTCPSFGPPKAIFEKLEPLMGILGIDQLILEPVWIHVSFTLRPRYSAITRA